MGKTGAACVALALASMAPAPRALEAPKAAPASAASVPDATAGRERAGAELFAAQCARCHGPHAEGSPRGPDLRRRTQGMSEQAFVDAVLRRYRWTTAPGAASADVPGRDALLRGNLTTRSTTDMPAWESDPEVVLGVRSLYAYVRAQSR
jgi:mono/diheme cytochrome c family protein